MKTLNQILSEIYKVIPDNPANPEVQFVKKHVISQFGVENGKDFAGNSIDGPPYKGVVKTYKRPPMHGYDHKGQDEKVYD